VLLSVPSEAPLVEQVYARELYATTRPKDAVRQRTAALRQSEKCYRYWVRTLPGAVHEFCVDAAGHRSLPFISNGLAEVTGVSPADAMVGRFSVHL